MQLRILFLWIILSFQVLAFSQQQCKIDGIIVDSIQGYPLMGANIALRPGMYGCITNESGRFNINISKGSYSMIISYVGYQTYTTAINLIGDTSLNLKLSPISLVTEEVIVSAKKGDENLKNTNIGNIEIGIKEIKELPSLFGEIDPLKILLFTPGIVQPGEGNMGIYVRGGSADQNLILLNGATIYNPYHLFGSFSIFNPDIVSKIIITKAGMDAVHGGRLASIIDVGIKNKPPSKPTYHSSMGLLASRLTIELPILKNKCFVMFGGRRTYMDYTSKILVDKFVKNKTLYSGNSYYFYDLDFHFFYKPSNKNQFEILYYYGRDYYSLNKDEIMLTNKINWGNMMGSFGWKHLFNNNFSVDNLIFYSSYNFELNANALDNYFILNSNIRDLSIKNNFSWNPNEKHHVKYGLAASYRTFLPGDINAKLPNVTADIEDYKLNSAECNLYYSHEYYFSSRIFILGSLRYTNYQQVGPLQRFVYNDLDMITDTLYYKKMEVVRPYNRVSSMISASYGLSKNSSLKLSVAQQYQFIHLASNGSVSLPTDTWLPATYNLKPQKGNQFSLGYHINFANNLITTSVEIYYKKLFNLVEFKKSLLQISPDNSIEHDIAIGEGSSYGMELFIRKQKGNFTSWISYTLSKTDRYFPDLDNEPFPAKYDRKHDLSFVTSYRFNNKWSCSANFVYATGNCLTLPVSRYLIQGIVVNEYGKPNSFRMPPYHRLDLSVDYTVKKDKRYKSTLNFSIYNVYSRANPYYIYVEAQGDIEKYELMAQAKQVALFPIMPSVTWSFCF